MVVQLMFSCDCSLGNANLHLLSLSFFLPLLSWKWENWKQSCVAQKEHKFKGYKFLLQAYFNLVALSFVCNEHKFDHNCIYTVSIYYYITSCIIITYCKYQTCMYICFMGFLNSLVVTVFNYSNIEQFNQLSQFRSKKKPSRFKPSTRFKLITYYTTQL